jgi:hypothetical protein
MDNGTILSMQKNIQIYYDGAFYGPFQSNLTIRDISLALNLRYPVMLRSLLENRDCTLIRGQNEAIPSGFYEAMIVAEGEMLQTRSVVKESRKVSNPKCTLHAGTQTDTLTLETPNLNLSTVTQFPLSKSEMANIVDSMLQLIATIPPRYIKYNKAISTKIDTTLNEVDRWTTYTEKLYGQVSKSSNSDYIPSVSIQDFVTFLQYRTLFLLYDIWKTVWQKFAPKSRVYSLSKVCTSNSLDRIEHILNCLSSWRRMMKSSTWSSLQSHFSLLGAGKQERSQKCKLSASRLPSQEHCGDAVFLTQQRPEINATLNKENELRRFRILFIQKIRDYDAFTDRELSQILHEMVKEQEQNMSAEFPSHFIKASIKQEFLL